MSGTDIRAVLAATAGPPKPEKPKMKRINVIAFGGLGGSVFSAGLQTLLMRLNAVEGIDFKTFQDYTSWRRWGDTLKTWKDPTVFIGHSFGVAAMFGCIRALGSKGPSVPLCISFDPSQWTGFSIPLWGSGGNVVPDRPQRVINFYQSSGLIGRQKLYRADGSLRGIENFNIQGTMHSAIEDNPELHRVSVEEIKKVITRA
jgi:hypothetical protein